MTTRIVAAALAVALAAGTGVSLAQTKPSGSAPGAAAAPERIEGQVVKIDRKTNMVTLRLADGSTQEFQANKETIADLKVGDRLEAKKRN
jgi:hypothetical protein